MGCFLRWLGLSTSCLPRPSPLQATVRFAAMDAAPDTVEGSVDMLMAKGCTRQLNRLVDTMSEAEAK